MDVINTNNKGKAASSESPPAEKVILAADEALQFALQLHRNGSLDAAETLYRHVIASAPKNQNAMHYMGVLCSQQNRHAEAAELIERIIAFDPQNVDAHNNLGNVLEGLGKFSEAEACYRKAIVLRPSHDPAHNNLGVVLMAQRKVAEALDAYRRAVALAPDSADYRYNMGNALRKSGEIDEAVGAYQEAVSLNPDHSGARQGLVRTLLQAGRCEEAAGVFDEWLRKEPGNPVILYLQAACLGKGVPDRAPDAYVQQIFDDLADSFDAHLVKNLDYRAPALIIDALASVLPPPDATLDILDAGCGTGQCGPLLRPYARRLIGVDLSAKMLTKAAGRKTYDDLVKFELTEFLSRQTEAYDIIASADTLCYFGNLEPVFQSAYKALKPGGLLAFTLEDKGEEAPESRLNPHGRYSHANSYVANSLDAAKLAIQSISSVVLRNEGKQPVAGHLVVAKKQDLR
ncbi:MAG: class I SAM-dependent DNA methyltransferase [Planctomycetota bacterium]|jgi:predicted TPR repeat methyltransferase